MENEEINCFKPCKTKEEYETKKRKCPPDSFFGIRTNFSSGKTSIELGTAGPVVLTTSGAQIDFGGIGGDDSHLRLTSDGLTWKW